MPSLSGLVTSSSQFAIVTGTALLGSLYLAISSPQPTPLMSVTAMTAVACVIAVAAMIAIYCALRLPRLEPAEDRGA